MINCSLESIIGVYLLINIIIWVNVLIIHYFVKCVIKAFGLKPSVSKKENNISHQEDNCTAHYEDIYDTINEQNNNNNQYSVDMNGLFEYPEDEHNTSFLYDDDVEIVTPEQEVEMERIFKK